MLSDKGQSLFKCKCSSLWVSWLVFLLPWEDSVSSLKVPHFAHVDATPGILALGADFSCSPRTVFPKGRMTTTRVRKMILGDRRKNILIAIYLCIWKKYIFRTPKLTISWYCCLKLNFFKSILSKLYGLRHSMTKWHLTGIWEVKLKNPDPAALTQHGTHCPLHSYSRRP